MMLEIRRKLVHASGVFLIFIIIWLGKWNAALLILLMAAAFLLLGLYRKDKQKYKIIKSKKLDELEEAVEKMLKEHERPNTLPFKGTTEFFIGCFLVTLIFQPVTAIAAIAILSLSDAMSTLIGSYYGKHKLPINKRKTFEGSTAFFLTSIFVLLFFVNPLKAIMVAILATLAEMMPKIDDNLTVPIVVGIFMTLIS